MRLYFLISHVMNVRSDQVWRGNFFSEYEKANKPFHVTLAVDDSNHFSAHKVKTTKTQCDFLPFILYEQVLVLVCYKLRRNSCFIIWQLS
jgi:hypothetical protein